MAGILDFLSAGYFHGSVNVDEDSIRWQNGLVSKLHKATGTILGLFTCTVFAKEVLGDHIHCISPREETGISREALNSYCYISTTFTLPEASRSEYQPHPGIGPYGDNTPTKYHSYYQWVPYLLFLQAISFYLPYTMFKFSQDGRISKLLQDLQNVIPFNENREDKLGDIHLYLQDFYGSHSWWARKLLMSDFMNLINIILNIFFMDWYLGSIFINYAPKVISYQSSDVMEAVEDPFDKIFPKMTKCTLEMFGPSGTIQTHDSLCVMPINVLNEKLYFIIWLLLLPLLILTIVDQIFWFFMLASKKVRNYFLVKFVSEGKPNSRQRLQRILEDLPFSDWLVLYLIARNIDSALFTSLAEKIDKPGAGYYPEEEDE